MTTTQSTRTVAWYEDTAEVSRLAHWMHSTGRIVDPVDLLALVDAPWHHATDYADMLAEQDGGS